MICPHVDKSDSIIWDDVAHVKEKIYNIECSRKSREYRKFTNESNGIKFNPVKFSDCHNWNSDKFKWTGCYLDEYKTFENIKHGLKMMEVNNDQLNNK
jgi:hypothetical protein